uniref:Cytoplasmic tRNA 2-thiolation protein 2 n=1 Tax=Periophthalmus magnuspinnatus TaxID=409849 RepID=A0A3B4AFR4_9GOBI
MIDVLLNLCFRVIFCRFLKRNLFVMCQVDEDYGRDIRSADFLSISKQCVKCKVHTPAVLLRIVCSEGALIGRSLEDRHKTNTNIRVLFESTGFPFHIVPLEQVSLPTLVLTRPHMSGSNCASSYKVAVGKFDQNKSCAIQPSCQQKEPVDVSKVHTVQLQQLVTSVKTHTAREELLNMLRQHLLLHMARIEGYSKLMLGDNCTRLAVKLLSNISLGRGSQTALDTGFSDSRYGDVIAVRPMRDYSAKEIAYYNHLFNVPYVFISGLDSKASDKDSIQRLTESFVTKLQTAFPSTVRTIYRSAYILHLLLCMPQSLMMLLCLCKLEAVELKTLLCYSCQLTIKDMVSGKGAVAGLVFFIGL